MADSNPTETYDDAKEDLFQAKIDWLTEQGASYKDLLEDDDGEYILVEVDNGNPSEEGYNVSTVKTYLPDNFQNI